MTNTQRGNTRGVSNSSVATVSLKVYNAILHNAGFSGHGHLTGENIELTQFGDVTMKSLAHAHRALEKLKTENDFQKRLSNNYTLQSGVKKLSEFLSQYKDS